MEVQMSDVISLIDLGIELTADIPDFFGKTTTKKAYWMRQVMGEIFEMGFGNTIWIVLLVEGKVEPLYNAMGFTEDETKVLDLFKSLNVPQESATNKIFQRRAEEFYAKQDK